MAIDRQRVKGLYQEAVTQRQAAWNDVERAWKRYEKQAYRKRSYREKGPKNFDAWADFRGEKRKEGRPSIWRGIQGYLLVSEVEKIRAADEKCTVAKAIRKAVRTASILKDRAEVRRISDRALQARYQQAAEYWADAILADLKKELERAQELHEMALSNENTIGSLLDMLEEETLCNAK
jgi:hypothetical protein